VSEIFARAEATDLRLGYNGLFRLVRDALGRDPMEGASYVFINRRRTSAKVLRHDGSGMTIFMKRLDRGRRFAPLWARAVDGEVTLTVGELRLLLDGSQQVGYMELVPPKK
jgi:transposase